MKRNWNGTPFALSVFLVFLFTRLSFAVDQNFPPPLDFGPTNEYGRGVQRSLRLMQDSSPTKKRTVRVLFYGQSVTLEPWSNWVADYLRRRFTNCNLVIENRAVSFETELLERTAEADVYPFYPDLLIYQNYGTTGPFENLVARTRLRTTADILIQTDHISHPEDLNELTDTNTPALLADRAWRNYVALPQIAERYGAELADVRTYWRKYLLAYNIPVVDLLRDQIHPNFQGDYLMTELITSHFRVDHSFSDDLWRDAEKNYTVGSDVNWTNDVLTLPFVGNRVDLLFSDNGSSAVDVRIDGKRPSEFPELYTFTRTGYYPDTAWVSIPRVTSRAPLIVEDWTATILESRTNYPPAVRYSVTGSKTGFDGEGWSTNLFISNSGRVVLESYDWLMLYWAYVWEPYVHQLPVGYQIKWSVRSYAKDNVMPKIDDPTIEATATVAQGLANGPHVLTLIRHGDAPVSGIRIFNPLARKRPLAPELLQIGQIRANRNNLSISSYASGRYVIEGSSEGFANWRSISAPLEGSAIEIPLTGKAEFFRLRRID